MSENEIGVYIGEQQVVANLPFDAKLPSTFPNPFPPAGDPRENNIIFNNNDGYGWTIFDSQSGHYNNQQLNESAPYSYGEDVEVRANWLKRVQTIIWCETTDNPQIPVQDLISHVHVAGGQGWDVDPQRGEYSFFPDNENVMFYITGANQNGVVVVDQRPYKFIAWATTPPPDDLAMRWDICSMGTQHTHQNVEFNNLCLHDEYAVFLDGENIKIYVKTNDDDGVEEFNYNMKIQYRLKWFNSVDTHQQEFITIPPDPTITVPGPYEVPSSHILNSFTLEACDNNGSPLYSIREYELKGWYFGNYQGKFDPDAYQQLLTDPNFHPGYVSPQIQAYHTPIEITAIFMPSDNTFTITYYSGLPELNG